MFKVSMIGKSFSRYFRHFTLRNLTSQLSIVHHNQLIRYSTTTTVPATDVKKATDTKAKRIETQSNKAKVTVTFVKGSGERITVDGKEGDNLLDIVVNNNIDLDGYGACEGTLACSTCHLIFNKNDYDRISEKPTDEELDMLDLAYELTDTSRLGCQVFMTKDFDGLEVNVPAGVNDQRSN